MMCVLFMYNRFNHIGGVIICVLASKAKGCGFGPRSIKWIGICCFSAKHTTLRSNSKD